MFKKFTRPPDEKDKKIIEDQVNMLTGRPKSIKRYILTVSLIVIAGGIPLVIWQGQKSIDMLYFSIGFVLVLLAIVGWAYLDLLKDNKKEILRYKDFLKNGHIKALHCQSEKMVEMEEIDDEGVAYFFQVEENKILFLGGQKYYPTEDFPNSDFEIADFIGQNNKIIWSEIYCHGNKIEPQRIIDRKIKEKIFHSPRFPKDQDREIIDGSIENIEEIIS